MEPGIFDYIFESLPLLTSHELLELHDRVLAECLKREKKVGELLESIVPEGWNGWGGEVFSSPIPVRLEGEEEDKSRNRLTRVK